MQTSTGGNELRLRLAEVVRGHSQAKLARETGHTASNISRYLRGMRVPAEFCIALVEKLGVNPAWLLAGQGAMYLADVHTGGEGVRARDLLELVQAMAAVSRVKLGALAGRADRKMLRELSDAIAAHERIRAQVRDRTAPFFEQLLVQLKSALEARELDHAEFLRNAARQCARFCDDEGQLRLLDHFEAHLLSMRRRDEEALALQRRALGRYLVAEAPDELAMREINAHAGSLMRVGRIEHARRVARAAQETALDQSHTGDFQMLRLTEGMALMLLGRLREGSAIVFDAANRMGPAEGEYWSHELLTVEYFLGLRDLPAILAAHRRDLKEGRAARVVDTVAAVFSFVFFEENAALAREALDLYGHHAATAGRVTPVLRAYGEAMIASLRGESNARKLAREYLDSGHHAQRLSAQSIVDRFRAHVTGGALARLCGWKARATQDHAAAVKLLSELPASHQIPVLQLALHHKNALALGGRDAVLARQYFEDLHVRGYGCFARVLQTTAKRSD